MNHDERHYAPMCRCGSRRTERVGFMQRRCHNCGRTFHFRLHDGSLVPMAKETAQAWDEERSLCRAN